MSLKSRFLVLLCSCLWSGLAGQPPADSTVWIDASSIRLSQPIRELISGSFIPSSDRPDTLPDLTGLEFRAGPYHPNYVPTLHVSNIQVVRFQIFNPTDSIIPLWFFSGLYMYDIRLFRQQEERLIRLPDIRTAEPVELAYRKLLVPAGDSMTVVATMRLVRTHLNRVRPELINENFLNGWIVQMDSRNTDSKVVSYIFCGLLLMMVLFSLTSFFQNAIPEFLYYSGYTLLTGIMLFMKAMYSYHSTWFSFFQEGYLDFIMQSVALMFYMLFMQKFLATRTNHPFLHKLYNFGKGMLLISMVLFTYFHYFTDNYPWENRVENLTKVLLLVMILVFLVYSLRVRSDKLLRYLFYGNLCLLVFSLISLLLLTGNLLPPQLPLIFRTSLFYYELGIFLELVLFLAGLNHKNKRQLITQARERERLKADNQMKEYEKEIAVYKAQQTERERISADMHDELGSGMTAIRLMSEIARNKMKESTPVEIDKISHSADEVLNKMNAIIWSMNSGNDTLDNLVSYIRAYALEYFEYTPINCRIIAPDEIPALELAGDRRRNLFLCVKETLNNTLKHSNATEVSISFEIDRELSILIRDNGVGVDLQHIRQFGNGLKNITKRMNSIGGTYDIKNEGGTVTSLRLPL